MTASDPSLWEEQSHRECSPEKDAYGLDKYRCNLATLNRPGQPDQPTTTAGGPRAVTITTRQAATLIASGSGITRQPPGPKVIISKAFIVYTNPAVRYQTTTILGTSIEVEFTPTSYTWGWGDGTTTTTTDPGAPYPHQTVTHHYQHTATGITTTLTTTWTTRYRPAGESQWRPIEGTITTTETSTPYDLVRIITYLTDDAEQAQGH
nr:zinc transporter [Actinomyces oris]